jgi:hypothetical protein
MYPFVGIGPGLRPGVRVPRLPARVTRSISPPAATGQPTTAAISPPIRPIAIVRTTDAKRFEQSLREIRREPASLNRVR